ncbi:uncharacterized protein RHOBADRAFT_56510 [Rhodotorula graminis WP1]|uniref:RCC1-like domain-containing protein n=1 Tax=Rhodotorula graminis (strain WP1) TaxID=578459 RepID=A0A0P9GW71_RHOGW|nr:uncharacterized protein RHOBADRAFT_56510 [Rhodotorula graminis WP1]KPV71679.1 hypothetical protein RHOBADRAFT_56510 [Rhodotorula graminis WP1]
MPPKRPRSSIASAKPASTPARRSSRISVVPTPSAAPQNPPTTSRRGRRASSPLSSVEGSDDADAVGPASKKRRMSSASSAPRAKKVVAPKPLRPAKPLPAPVQGMNPIPQLWSLFPPESSFSSAVEFEPVPPHADAPRQVQMWGDGSTAGQFGMGTVRVKADEPVRQTTIQKKIRTQEAGWEDGPAEICAAGMHTLLNDHATLGRQTAGDNSDELESVPMPVEYQDASIIDSKPTGYVGHPFRAVRCYAGDSISLAQDERGDVKVWGAFRNSQGPMGFIRVPEVDAQTKKVTHEPVKLQWRPTALSAFAKHAIVQIACGDEHYLALTTTGDVLTAGVGDCGQLGRRIMVRADIMSTLTPQRLGLKNIVLVGAGAYHSFAVDKDGDVFGWGNHTYRQTGVAGDGGKNMKIEEPTFVKGLSPADHAGARVVQIACGGFHTVFLFSNGEVWTVGRVDEGECGLPDDHPEMVDMRKRRADAQVKQAAWKDAERKTYFLEDGTTVDPDNEKAYHNKDGKFELMTAAEIDHKLEQVAAVECPLPNDYVATPSRVDFPLEPASWDGTKTQDDYDEEPQLCTKPTRIVHVASAGQYSIAVSARGYVYTWGYGPTEQLGAGGSERERTPRRILNDVLKGLRAIKADAGGQHCLVVSVSRDWEQKKREREQKRAEEADKARQADKDEAAAAAAAVAEAAGGVAMADGSEGVEK